MHDWFTIIEVDADTYAICEDRHWERVRSYLLVGSTRAILIDTGLGVADIRQVVSRFTSLPVTVVTTHGHWDHIGGHGLFSEILIHEKEAAWISGEFPIPLSAVKANLLREPNELPSAFDLDVYRVYAGGPTACLVDGDCLELGNRKLVVYHTPGHSPGHICLWEADRGYLFTGDLIYCGCLYAFYPSTDPVAYLHSVHRLQELPVKKLLPAHHTLNLPEDFLRQVDAGLQELCRAGKLHHGSGLFTFSNFSIQM